MRLNLKLPTEGAPLANAPWKERRRQASRGKRIETLGGAREKTQITKSVEAPEIAM